MNCPPPGAGPTSYIEADVRDLLSCELGIVLPWFLPETRGAGMPD